MKNNNQNRRFMLKSLTMSMLLLSGHSFALQTMQDEELRSVNGQDGVKISTTLSEANIDQLYWSDDAGRGSISTNTALKATADHVKIQKSNASNQALGAEIKINNGSSDGNKVGMDLSGSLSPALLTVDSFRICDNEATANCSPEIGSLALQTTSAIDFSLRTKDGLFSKENLGELVLGIKNANIYLGQTDVNSKLNQLILKNFNFNFAGRGVMFVDATEGLRLQTNTRNGNTDYVAGNSSVPDSQLGYVDLNRVVDSAAGKTGFVNTGTYVKNGATTNAGLNIEMMLNKDVKADQLYSLDPTTNSPSGSKGLIRVGASGRMVNASLQFRGFSVANADKDKDVLGYASSSSGAKTTNNVMGNSGIAFRMKTEFTRDGDSMLGSDGQATTLEIGGAGLNAYGFEFSNLTGLSRNDRASFDTGNVYLNLVDSKMLKLPENTVFQNSRFGNGDKLTSSSDYIQYIHNQTSGLNPYSVVMALRGAEFQSISRRGRFTTSAGMEQSNLFTDSGLSNEWGLALPFYNLNANLAMYGTKVKATDANYYTISGDNITKNKVATSGDTARLGLSLAMSTEGHNATGSKTTSIMVIDGGTDKGTHTATDYYMGLRNIDMLLTGNGNMGVENGSVNFSLQNMLIVMSAEVAAGYLPGTTYKTCKLNSAAAGCASSGTAPINSFVQPDDVLFGVKLRVGGDVDFSLIPNNSVDDGSRLSIAGELALKGDKNTIQISDPQNGSTVGFDHITGKLGFNNAIVVSKDQISGNGQVGFNTKLIFNPDHTTDGVFRVRDINFYPPTTGSGARLGELAITGGRISSEFNIIPRN